MGNGKSKQALGEGKLDAEVEEAVGAGDTVEFKGMRKLEDQDDERKDAPLPRKDEDVVKNGKSKDNEQEQNHEEKPTETNDTTKDPSGVLTEEVITVKQSSEVSAEPTAKHEDDKKFSEETEGKGEVDHSNPVVEEKKPVQEMKPAEEDTKPSQPEGTTTEVKKEDVLVGVKVEKAVTEEKIVPEVAVELHPEQVAAADIPAVTVDEPTEPARTAEDEDDVPPPPPTSDIPEEAPVAQAMESSTEHMEEEKHKHESMKSDAADTGAEIVDVPMMEPLTITEEYLQEAPVPVSGDEVINAVDIIEQIIEQEYSEDNQVSGLLTEEFAQQPADDEISAQVTTDDGPITVEGTQQIPENEPSDCVSTDGTHSTMYEELSAQLASQALQSAIQEYKDGTDGTEVQETMPYPETEQNTECAPVNSLNIEMDDVKRAQVDDSVLEVNKYDTEKELIIGQTDEVTEQVGSSEHQAPELHDDITKSDLLEGEFSSAFTCTDEFNMGDSKIQKDAPEVDGKHEDVQTSTNVLLPSSEAEVSPEITSSVAEEQSLEKHVPDCQGDVLEQERDIPESTNTNDRTSTLPPSQEIVAVGGSSDMVIHAHHEEPGLLQTSADYQEQVVSPEPEISCCGEGATPENQDVRTNASYSSSVICNLEPEEMIKDEKQVLSSECSSKFESAIHHKEQVLGSSEDIGLQNYEQEVPTGIEGCTNEMDLAGLGEEVGGCAEKPDVVVPSRGMEKEQPNVHDSPNENQVLEQPDVTGSQNEMEKAVEEMDKIAQEMMQAVHSLPAVERVNEEPDTVIGQGKENIYEHNEDFEQDSAKSSPCNEGLGEEQNQEIAASAQILDDFLEHCAQQNAFETKEMTSAGDAMDDKGDVEVKAKETTEHASSQEVTKHSDASSHHTDGQNAETGKQE